MHCRRFARHRPLTRRDMLAALRQRLRRPGAAPRCLREPAFGATIGDAPAGRRCRHGRRSAGAQARPSSRRRPGASSSCTWTAGRRRSTRSTPSPGSTASTASRSRSRPSRRSSTTSATCSSARGSSASTARAASRSATCSRTSASCVDDLAIIRSMVSNFSEHTSANYFLHTGSGLQGRPSHGAWVTYGLGSECQDLPGFVVLNGGLIPPGGLDCFNSGFLPASYQGSVFKPGAPRRSPTSTPTESTPELAAPQARPAAHARPGRARPDGPPRQPRGGDRQLRAGLPDADRRPRADEPRPASRRRPGGSTAWTIPIRRPGSSPASA